jgi:hypothetical protein
VEYVTLARQPWDRLQLAAGLEGMAVLAAWEGQAPRAVQLFAVAASLRAQLGSRLMSLRNRTMIEEATRSCREQLGEEAWLAAWDAGQAMTVEQAIVYALEESSASTAPEYAPEEPSAPTVPPWGLASEPSPFVAYEGTALAPPGRRLSRAERQAWALAHLRAAGSLSPRAYASALAVSVDTALNDLRELQAQDLVRAEGSTRDRRYVLRVDEA